jgi:hypothetical protein
MDKKILLFTTAGKLEGENLMFTKASFSSWKKQNLDVVLFGEPFHKELCDEYGFILDINYERDEFGLPIVRDLYLSSQRYKGYDVYCFTNGDIIFHNSILDSINAITFDNFLAVGQRIDVFNLPEIDYLTESIKDIEDKLSKCSQELHNPGGIDYFAFTPGFWDLNNMPDFSKARNRYDHWLVGYGLTEGNGPVIDLTKTFTAYQPEPINRVRGTSSAFESYGQGNYKLGYQLFRNELYFFKANKHGQVDMAPYYTELDKTITLKQRLDKDIPQNEFKQKIIYNK